ncbi:MULTISPECIES: ankyrin repeat domain-containing protein [Niallia]|uniref:Ankyrin repeat domain-containing protein n=1 Tax=Niallia hominis TaxID=3133173 RepID=A0ABV1F030_9BACI|nr:ankyrin repeat domain-containing protein [Niallia sp. MER TA 168]MCM3362985.1 ankyrin repeat domain-containing protein [Niallia sp. MER TA 168]
MDDSLFQAVYMNDLDTVKKLLGEQNVDVNETDQLGRTLLQIACYFGFYEVCKKLLEKGAKIDEDCFRRAENSWSEFQHDEVIELLHEWQNR